MRLIFCWLVAGSKFLLNAFTFPKFSPALVSVSVTPSHDLAFYSAPEGGRMEKRRTFFLPPAPANKGMLCCANMEPTLPTLILSDLFYQFLPILQPYNTFSRLNYRSIHA